MTNKLLLLMLCTFLLSACVNIRPPVSVIEENTQTVEQLADSGTRKLLQAISRQRGIQHRLLSSRITVVPTRTGRSQQDLQFADRVEMTIRKVIKAAPRFQLVDGNDLRRPANFEIHSKILAAAVGQEEILTMQIWVLDRRLNYVVAAVKAPLHLNSCTRTLPPPTEQ